MNNELILMLKLASIVFFSAIFLLFSQEFGRILGKLFAIKGVKLLLPLIVASCCIELYVEELRSALLILSYALYEVMYKASLLLPFQAGLSAVKILFLFLIASLPVWLAWFQIRRNPLSIIPRFSYYIGFVIWIVTVGLMIQPVIN